MRSLVRGFVTAGSILLRSLTFVDGFFSTDFLAVRASARVYFNASLSVNYIFKQPCALACNLTAKWCVNVHVELVAQLSQICRASLSTTSEYHLFLTRCRAGRTCLTRCRGYWVRSSSLAAWSPRWRSCCLGSPAIVAPHMGAEIKSSRRNLAARISLSDNTLSATSINQDRA